MLGIVLWMTMRMISVAASSPDVEHCLIQDSSPNEDYCLRCEIGYILDQISTSCKYLEEQQEHLANCIQISDFGECMRCDCGYAFEIDHGICAMAIDSLLGCETFANGICIRPKYEYMLVKENNEQMFILFARGTHCEIFDALGKIYKIINIVLDLRKFIVLCVF